MHSTARIAPESSDRRKVRAILYRCILSAIFEQRFRAHPRFLAEQLEVRNRAAWDCYHPQGFVARACRAMGVSRRHFVCLAMRVAAGEEIDEPSAVRAVMTYADTGEEAE